MILSFSLPSPCQQKDELLALIREQVDPTKRDEVIEEIMRDSIPSAAVRLLGSWHDMKQPGRRLVGVQLSHVDYEREEEAGIQKTDINFSSFKTEQHRINLMIASILGEQWYMFDRMRWVSSTLPSSQGFLHGRHLRCSPQEPS